MFTSEKRLKHNVETFEPPPPMKNPYYNQDVVADDISINSWINNFFVLFDYYDQK